MNNINFCSKCGNQIKGNAKFCSKCGANLIKDDNDSHNYKKEKVLSKSHSRFRTINIILIIGFIGMFIIYFTTTDSKENEIINKQPQVIGSIEYSSLPTQMSKIDAKVENSKIIIPLDIVKQNKFVKFYYVTGSLNVPLLAYISESGKIITAISMCEPCNSTDFHIKGNELICNSCGTTWNLNNMNAISGSCGKYPPDPIPSTVNGNEIQIDLSNVTNWQRRI